MHHSRKNSCVSCMQQLHMLLHGVVHALQQCSMAVNHTQMSLHQHWASYALLCKRHAVPASNSLLLRYQLPSTVRAEEHGRAPVATRRLTAVSCQQVLLIHICLTASLFTQCRGCIFQVLPELVPGHAARADSADYFKRRESWPCCRQVTAFLQGSQLLELLQAAPGSTDVLLYNEQYIVKPALSSGSAFGWHYDSQWCGMQHGVQYSPYLSLWVALDDMTAANGCLMVLPGRRANRQTGSSGSGRSRTEACRHVGQAVRQPLQAPDVERVQYIQASCTEELLAQLDGYCQHPGACTAADGGATTARASSVSTACFQDAASSCQSSSFQGILAGCAVGLEMPAGTTVSCRLVDLDGIMHACTGTCMVAVRHVPQSTHTV
jgi:hypothetical protein